MRNAETWRLLEGKVGKALEKDPRATRVRYRRGEQVYEQGEKSKYMYVVLTGRVRVSMARADGFEFLLEIMGPGALMGEGPALDGEPRFASALATEESELLRFAVDDLPAAMEQNPELVRSLLSVTAAKQRNLANRLLALTMASPKSRIAEMLFRLSGSYGVKTGDQILIETRLSHEQIAALVGVTRVTVTRAMQDLTAAGIVKMDGSNIHILDTQRLHEFSIF